MILSVNHLFLVKGYFLAKLPLVFKIIGSLCISIRCLAFSLTEMLSFHPVESGRYRNFGYGNSRKYGAVNSECNHTNGMVNSKD